MQIGFFADMYTPHVSGVTNYIRLYKREFERLGHEVHVLTYGNRDHEDDEPNVVRSSGLPWLRTGWNIPGPVSSEAERVMKHLDVAHAHHPFVSGRIARRCHPRAALVFTNHTRYDIYSDTYAPFVPRGIRHSIVRNNLRGFYESCDAVLAPSPEIAEWIKSWIGYGKPVTFRNVIDVAPFAEPAKPRRKTDFGFSEDDVVVVYLGRVSEEKNMGLLVDSFVRAAAQRPELALLVIGDGPSRVASQKRLAELGMEKRARFLGMTAYEQVPDIMAAGDMFATASVSESYPLVVMEAAAAGLPAVGVRSPGVGEVILDGETGLLTTEDARSFSGALARIAADAKLRATLSAQAREAAARHDIKPAAERMLGLYTAILEGRGRQVS